MKFFKGFFLGLVVLVGGLYSVSFFLPESYHFQRDIVINAPQEKVFNYVVDYKNWDKFNVWMQVEPGVHTFSESQSEVGSFMAWNGKKIGKGSHTIINLEPPKRIEAELKFEEPYTSVADDIWVFEEAEAPGSTKVTWMSKGQLEGAQMKIMGLFMDMMLAEPFEQGLAKLKAELEEEGV